MHAARRLAFQKAVSSPTVIFRSASADMTTANTQDRLNVTMPSVENDWLMLLIFMGNNELALPTIPTGWSGTINGVTSTFQTTSANSGILWRTAAASDSGNIATVLFTGGNSKAVGSIVAYSGVNTADPFGAPTVLSTNTPNSTSRTAPSIVTDASQYVLQGGATKDSGSPTGNNDWSVPAPVIERAAGYANSGSGNASFVTGDYSTSMIPSGTTIPASTFTTSAGSNSGANGLVWSIALNAR